MMHAASLSHNSVVLVHSHHSELCGSLSNLLILYMTSALVNSSLAASSILCSSGDDVFAATAAAFATAAACAGHDH